MGFSRKNTNNMAWKSQEKRMKTINIQRFRAHEKKTNKQKTHEIKWSQSCFFSPRLFYDNEKAMSLNALLHGVRSYGVFIRVVKFMPR